MQRKFYIQGNISIPIIFPTRARSEAEAMSYVSRLINNESVIKIEADIYTKDGKCHLLICDEYNFRWNHK